MVTPAPPILIGSNFELFVKPKVVVPAKVTTAPGRSFVRSIVLLVGAKMSCSTIDLQLATAGAICAYAVQVHAFPEDVDVFVLLEVVELLEDVPVAVEELVVGASVVLKEAKRLHISRYICSEVWDNTYLM